MHQAMLVARQFLILCSLVQHALVNLRSVMVNAPLLMFGREKSCTALQLHPFLH